MEKQNNCSREPLMSSSQAREIAHPYIAAADWQGNCLLKGIPAFSFQISGDTVFTR
jgi:hypothetical protein